MLANGLRKNKWSDAFPNQNLSHSKYISSNILVFRILRNLKPKVNAILGNFLLLYKLVARAQLSQSNSELAQSLTTSKCTQQAKQKHYHKVHQNWWNSIQVNAENSPFSNSCQNEKWFGAVLYGKEFYLHTLKPKLCVWSLTLSCANDIK